MQRSVRGQRLPLTEGLAVSFAPPLYVRGSLSASLGWPGLVLSRSNMKCSKCLEELAEIEFSRASNKRGRNWYCKACAREAVNHYQWSHLLKREGQSALLESIARHRRLATEMEEWLCKELSSGPFET